MEAVRLLTVEDVELDYSEMYYVGVSFENKEIGTIGMTFLAAQIKADMNTTYVMRNPNTEVFVSVKQAKEMVESYKENWFGDSAQEDELNEKIDDIKDSFEEYMDEVLRDETQYDVQVIWETWDKVKKMLEDVDDEIRKHI